MPSQSRSRSHQTKPRSTSTHKKSRNQHQSIAPDLPNINTRHPDHHGLPHRRYTLPPPSFSTPGLAAASLNKAFYKVNHAQKAPSSTNSAMASLVSQVKLRRRSPSGHSRLHSRSDSSDSNKTSRRPREIDDHASHEVFTRTPSVFSFNDSSSRDHQLPFHANQELPESPPTSQSPLPAWLNDALKNSNEVRRQENGFVSSPTRPSQPSTMEAPRSNNYSHQNLNLQSYQEAYSGKRAVMSPLQPSVTFQQPLSGQHDTYNQYEEEEEEQYKQVENRFNDQENRFNDQENQTYENLQDQDRHEFFPKFISQVPRPQPSPRTSAEQSQAFISRERFDEPPASQVRNPSEKGAKKVENKREDAASNKENVVDAEEEWKLNDTVGWNEEESQSNREEWDGFWKKKIDSKVAPIAENKSPNVFISQVNKPSLTASTQAPAPASVPVPAPSSKSSKSSSTSSPRKKSKLILPPKIIISRSPTPEEEVEEQAEREPQSSSSSSFGSKWTKGLRSAEKDKEKVEEHFWLGKEDEEIEETSNSTSSSNEKKSKSKSSSNESSGSKRKSIFDHHTQSSSKQSSTSTTSSGNGKGRKRKKDGGSKSTSGFKSSSAQEMRDENLEEEVVYNEYEEDLNWEDQVWNELGLDRQNL